MNPFWIGVVGTVIALLVLANAVRLGMRAEGGSTIARLHAIMAVLFIGVIWFIILRLLPAG